MIRLSALDEPGAGVMTVYHHECAVCLQGHSPHLVYVLVP